MVCRYHGARSRRHGGVVDGGASAAAPSVPAAAEVEDLGSRRQQVRCQVAVCDSTSPIGRPGPGNSLPDRSRIAPGRVQLVQFRSVTERSRVFRPVSAMSGSTGSLNRRSPRPPAVRPRPVQPEPDHAREERWTSGFVPVEVGWLESNSAGTTARPVPVQAGREGRSQLFGAVPHGRPGSMNQSRSRSGPAASAPGTADALSSSIRHDVDDDAMPCAPASLTRRRSPPAVPSSGSTSQ